jgi:hypothetical protein
MHQLGFKPSITVFERYKIVRALQYAVFVFWDAQFNPFRVDISFRQIPSFVFVHGENATNSFNCRKIVPK